MENYLTYAGDSTDIFEALGMTEEWEDEETTNTYAVEDAKTLTEYGYWLVIHRWSCPIMVGI